MIDSKLQNRINSQSQALTLEKVERTIQTILSVIDRNMQTFKEDFPAAASKDLKYPITNNRGWTTGFWTGMLWLSFYHTKNDKYKKLALNHVKNFRERYEKRFQFDTHDLGFLYSLSCISAYKLTGDELAKETALMAADELMLRFKEKGQFIQAWGDINDRSAYRLIIDCMMNLPLLYWASEITGDEKYYNAAYAHAQTSMDVIVRDDNTTFHTFYFDPDTGDKVKGITAQGYSDNSCWARGQSWAIYGSALSYRYTKDKMFMDYNKRVADYFINRLPDDLVPYWDLIFTSGNEERDSSSAAITACGLIESVQYIKNDEQKNLYMNTAKAMLNSLIDNYMPNLEDNLQGLILHSVYTKPGNVGVDEFSIWGDYYFLEALLRILYFTTNRIGGTSS